MRWLSPAIRRDRGWPRPRTAEVIAAIRGATPAGNSAPPPPLCAPPRHPPAPARHSCRCDRPRCASGIIVLRLRKLAGFQGVIPLLYQQPVAVSLQQAVPLAAVRAVRVHGNRFTELRHCPRAVAALGIGSRPRAPTASLSRLSA